MRRFLSVLCAACVIFAASAVTATPIWRTDPPGQEPTTYQEWTFDDADNPALAEVDSNAYGDPMADITVEGDAHGAPGWYDQWLGRSGVWHGDLTTIILTIPNRPIPDLYKEIWVEVGFRGDLIGSGVTPYPGGQVSDLGSNITTEPDGWKVLTIGWRIEPNPEWEEILLQFQDSGADVDYVIVDTICIPEPATLLVVFVGGVLAVLRRSR